MVCNDSRQDHVTLSIERSGEKRDSKGSVQSSGNSSLMSTTADDTFSSRFDTTDPSSCENSRNVLLNSTEVKDGKEDYFSPSVKDKIDEHWPRIKQAILIIILVANFGYLLYAMWFDMSNAKTLLVMWIMVVSYAIISHTPPKLYESLQGGFAKVEEVVEHIWFRQGLVIAFIMAIIAFICIDTRKRPRQLISLAGYITIMFLLYCFSKHRTNIIWRPVIGGVMLQFCMAFFVLRSDSGFLIFSMMANQAQTFTSYIDEGSKFVFGNEYYKHFFAFRVLPIIIYFSSFISVLYHLGVMQFVIKKIAWVMQRTLGTSPPESMVAAGNIFVGQTESPLLIRPYIKDLTISEMHSVMTAGFGTIAGSVLGAYLGFGIQALAIISACVMAAPCALAVSKLFYPETETTKFQTSKHLKVEESEHKSIIEAAFVGASQAIPLVLNIAANLIAFLSLLAMINGLLAWYGGLSGHPNLSFQLICSYMFIPMSFMMGIEWSDCFKASELIGTKIFLNEFIAYTDLSTYIDARENGTIPKFDEDGAIQWVSVETETILTFALCGFANVGSIGIMLGGLSALCPERQGEMVKIIIRALIAGILVSILNACVSGFMFLPPPVNCTWTMGAYEHWNYTNVNDLSTCCIALQSVNTTSQTSTFFRNQVCCDTTYSLNTTITC